MKEDPQLKETTNLNLLQLDQPQEYLKILTNLNNLFPKESFVSFSFSKFHGIVANWSILGNPVMEKFIDYKENCLSVYKLSSSSKNNTEE